MVEPSRPQLIEAEFERLRLRVEQLPYQAIAASMSGGFLDHLRSLAPGATWHDVFPDLPSNWRPGDQLEFPDRPIGPFDQPDPPRGAIITIVLADGEPFAAAHSLVEELRKRGVPIYGYGLDDHSKDPVVMRVVLDSTADSDILWESVDWLHTRPVVQGIAVPRDVPMNEDG